MNELLGFWVHVAVAAVVLPGRFLAHGLGRGVEDAAEPWLPDPFLDREG